MAEAFVQIAAEHLQDVQHCLRLPPLGGRFLLFPAIKGFSQPGHKGLQMDPLGGHVDPHKLFPAGAEGAARVQGGAYFPDDEVLYSDAFGQSAWTGKIR